MRTYLFWVTLRINLHGEPSESDVMRGAKAASEFEARRKVLNHFLEDGYQVRRIKFAEHAA